MASDAAKGALKVIGAILENSELVIQLAQELQNPGLINQDTAELHERFAAYRTVLAKMTDQEGKIVPLPQGLKLEKPK